MKSLITTLSILTLAMTTGSLNNIWHTTCQKNNIITNNVAAKTQQYTKYIDQLGKEVTINKKDLSNIITKEVTQIGFYQNEKREIQVVTMPKTIEKVPNKLPPEITSLKNMFTNASLFNQNILSWDTSHVTTMWGMFYEAKSFNKNIHNWNVAKVTDMSIMFGNDHSFNQNISPWNVENVVNMTGMFFDTKKFNQDISNWNVSKVVRLEYMFFNAKKFNQDLSPWNTANVINMTGMFF